MEDYRRWKEIVIVDCISDLHGFYPKLEGGDLLIVAGDLTASDKPHEYNAFTNWLYEQKYRKKIIISGNHDNWISNLPIGIWKDELARPFAEYLCDSGTEFEGLKIWGSPWTLRFEGENPKCLAFTCETEEQLAEKWAMIPADTDILVTHSPPHNMFDKCIDGRRVGSTSLRETWLKISPRLHVYGHIHESYGEFYFESGITSVNASHVNECYKPIRIEL